MPYWGRGFATEAARELLRHAFEELCLSRIWCRYFEGNERSKRVSEKLGFKYQRTIENVCVQQMNEARKGYVSCLTKEEWLSVQQRSALYDRS